MQSDFHTLARIGERLTDSERADVQSKLAELTVPDMTRSYAVRVHRLAAMRGYAWSDTSNGSDVWAIVRDGRVRTVMLRRASQPHHPAAFQCDRVILAD